MRASVVSSPIAVTRTSRAPPPLIVPANTRSPGRRVTGTDSPDPIDERSPLTYTVTVRNDGPAGATGVTLLDTLPDAGFVSATPSQGSCVRTGKGQRDGTLTCELGTLAPAGSATVAIVVTPTRAGTLTNVVLVRADQPDADRADNTAVETTTVVPR